MALYHVSESFILTIKNAAMKQKLVTLDHEIDN